MKRVAFLLLVAAGAWGQTTVYTSNPVFSWDPVTQLVDGTTVGPSDIEYRISYYDEANPTLRVTVATIPDTTYTLTVPDGARWVLAVQAINVHSNTYGALSRSDDPLVTASGGSVVVQGGAPPQAAPVAATGLSIQ